MKPSLPDSLVVIERGWLSSNNVVCFDGDEAALIDSGYVSHAGQTVELVRHALDGRQLKRLINTHSHSDHIGGNAALKAAFGCEIIVPAGLHAAIAEWDEDALLLSPLGQQSARFQHDALISADPVFIGGTAAFALTRQTLDVDTDGNGAADLIGATLDVLALSVSSPVRRSSTSTTSSRRTPPVLL